MIFLIGMVGSMTGLLIGYNTAVIAPALEFIAQDFALGAFMQGVAVSSVPRSTTSYVSVSRLRARALVTSPRVRPRRR